MLGKAEATLAGLSGAAVGGSGVGRNPPTTRSTAIQRYPPPFPCPDQQSAQETAISGAHQPVCVSRQATAAAAPEWAAVGEAIPAA